MKNRVKQAQLSVVPYNYLIESDLRKNLKLDNSIIIFDEGHNLP